jgi:hypothetical protein
MPPHHNSSRAAREMKPNLLCAMALLAALTNARGLDLGRAVVVFPPGLSGPEKRAVAMLLDEAEKRAHFRWASGTAWPSSNAPVIAVGPVGALDGFAGEFAKGLREDFLAEGRKGQRDGKDGKDGKEGREGREGGAGAAEGYRLCVKRGADGGAVFVLGNDARGVLFGVGRLLRELRLAGGTATLADDLDIVTAPKYPLRGHQLGYRPKCNSYDAWDLPVWEQYFRDLAVFGANSIELIPPRSDDASDSPHFPRPPMEMMIGMSKLADDYGLDVWVWYPAMDKDYSDAKTVEFAVEEWGAVFRKLPRIDAVFVPGGDPGHTRPKDLMVLLGKETENLHRFHPKAQMWVSPQSFNQVWLDEFIEILNRERPAWLHGVVFGPQQRGSMARLRQLVPPQYPIRLYPDITHSRQCQYPVPDWDTAYAVTEARECINPRPRDEAAIFRATEDGSTGFLTYSEGCNDDVNKMVWSALGWNPEARVEDILREYGRYFIGERHGDDFARGLLALEQNWRGPLLGNEEVYGTLAQFQALEKTATPFELRNWRFQQALFRAYYDASVRRRLIYETGLEEQALESLRRARPGGAVQAMAEAERILERAVTRPVGLDWRARVFELGEALFQSIGMQLSVEKYQAISVDRGASLDTLDSPLNNRLWLEDRFARGRSLSSESARLTAIGEIIDWTNPGPGGFYDDLGNPARQSHLVRGKPFAQDPGSLESARVDFEESPVVEEPGEKAGGPRRVSWVNHEESLYDAPLQMRYTGLDPEARYSVRVVYGGDSPRKKIRLAANDGLEVHPFLTKPFPLHPVEFPVPRAATSSGDLTLSWFAEPGLGGNGRGCQVAEVWLIKQQPPKDR